MNGSPISPGYLDEVSAGTDRADERPAAGRTGPVRTGLQAVEVDAPREDFAVVSQRYRQELVAYCYRMLGSIHDAEDLVQETYLRAWRSYGDFEGRASVRTWLYRIATNACLTAIEHRSRRMLPSGLVGPGETLPEAPLGPAPPEVSWLQPIPDNLLSSRAADPAAVVAERTSFRLALTAALQYLPARQRAAFILREGLAMPAAEIARLLGTTVPAVKSALQRARAQLDELAPIEDEVTETGDPAVRTLVDQFVVAFDEADLARLLKLLTADVVVEMPPTPSWFVGHEQITRLFRSQVFAPRGTYRMVPSAANGQPAFGVYQRGEDGLYRADSVKVLTIARVGTDAPPRISRISSFREPALFGVFGLPATLAEPVGPC